MSDTDDPGRPAAPSARDHASVDAPDTGAIEADTQKAAVGYGQPPIEHRFRKGDGRKRGRRPKGGSNAKTILRKEHNRAFKIHEPGGVRKKTALELVIRRDVADAVKGVEKAKARHIHLGLQQANEDEAKAALKSQGQTPAEDEAILARYLTPARPEPPESGGSGQP